MENSIEKFRLFLKEYAVSITLKSNEIAYDNEIVINNKVDEALVLLDIIDGINNKQSNGYFNELDRVSYYLSMKGNGLSNKDKYNIIKFFINYNHLLSQVNRNLKVVSYGKFKNFNFKNITSEEKELILDRKLLSYFSTHDYESLTEDEKRFKNAIDSNIDAISIDFHDIFRVNEYAYHFMNTKINPNRIKIITFALNKLSVSKPVLNDITIYLNSKITVAREEKNINIKRPNYKKGLDLKSYKLLEDELYSIYNPKSRIITKNKLNYEDLKKGIELLKLLKYNDDEIRSFAREFKIKFNDNLISLYTNYYRDRIIYYLQNEELIKKLDRYVSLYNLSNDLEEKEIYYLYLEDELNNIILPNSYDYEVKKSKSL